MRAFLVHACTVAALLTGCDYCAWKPTDPGCPPPRTSEQLICDRLVECGRFAAAEYEACLRNHQDLGVSPQRCLECVETNDCDDVAGSCADSC